MDGGCLGYLFSSVAQTDPFNAGQLRARAVSLVGVRGTTAGTSLRTASRIHNPTSSRFNGMGFRVGFQQVPHIVELNSTVSLEMIWVEPGTFTMGSPTTEAGRQDE